MTAMAVRVSSHPSPHVIKCHYTLISLLICPLTSSSSLLLVGSRFANPWVLRRLQYTGMWKSILFFHCADPWISEDSNDDKTLTKPKLDSTLLPHNLFWAYVGIEVKRERERNIIYYLTKLEVTDDKCVPRLQLGPNIYRLLKGRGPQSSFFSLIPPAVVLVSVCVSVIKSS